MAKTICCKDAGVNCDWTGRAETEDELIEKVKEHAKKDHGMPVLPDVLLQQARKIMRDC